MELAATKSGAVLLASKKTCAQLTITVEGDKIKTLLTALYLVTILNKAMRRSVHVRCANATRDRPNNYNAEIKCKRTAHKRKFAKCEEY